MRILYVITDLKVGGVPLHLLRLATALDPRRFTVAVASLADIGPVGERLLRAGIQVGACEAAGPWDARALGRLYGYIRARRPHILHSLLFHANVACRLVGPVAGVPIRRILCEIQTAEYERPWHLSLDGATVRLCRLEIGNSPSVICHLHRHAHIPHRRLRLIEGGVDVEAIAAARPADRAALGVSPDAPLVLWVGRLDPVKGLDELVDAAKILREGGATPTFLLAGAGRYEATLRRRIASVGAQEYVRLLGRRDDVASLLKAADVFAFPSRTEGLPNALMEAMAAGASIVTTDAAGCRDLVRNGETGLVVPVGDAAALAAAIRRLLEDRALRQRLGAAAAVFARDRCSWTAAVARYAELYEEVADR